MCYGFLCGSVLNFRAVKNPAIWLAIAIINTAILGLIFSAVVNVDYGAFYSAGRVALENPHHVYDKDVQEQASRPRGYLPYYHLPHELAIYAPLSLLPFQVSLWTWRILSLGFLIAAALLSASMFGLPKLLTVFQFAAFVPVIHCLCHGQDSILMLLLLTASLYFLNRDEPFIAGAVLALSIFKPQVPAVVALAMLIAGHRRFLVGFAFTGAGILIASTGIFGISWVGDWLSLLRWSESREVTTQAVSIHGLMSMLGAFWGFAPAITISLGLIVLRFQSWRQSADQNAVFCSAILVGSLTAFHFHIQDVSMLLLPIALLMNRGLEVRWSVLPLFASPVILFLMYEDATALAAISSIVLLASMLRVMIPGINCRIPAPPAGVNTVAVSNE
jgi:hypothetical protein